MALLLKIRGELQKAIATERFILSGCVMVCCYKQLLLLHGVFRAASHKALSKKTVA